MKAASLSTYFPNPKSKPHLSQRTLLFDWRKIASQCCVGFCHTAVQASHNYTYILPLLSLPLLPHPTPLGHHRAPGNTPCVMQQLPTSYLFHSGYCIYAEATLSIHPLSPSPTVSASPSCASVSPFLPFKQVYQYHFSRLHIAEDFCKLLGLPLVNP